MQSLSRNRFDPAKPIVTTFGKVRQRNRHPSFPFNEERHEHREVRLKDERQKRNRSMNVDRRPDRVLCCAAILTTIIVTASGLAAFGGEPASGSNLTQGSRCVNPGLSDFSPFGAGHSHCGPISLPTPLLFPAFWELIALLRNIKNASEEPADTYPRLRFGLQLRTLPQPRLRVGF